eukprot:CAMPEP_0201621100 /NCGR_PEP_ID=MMETSP0492-20130828/45919_1 /ASSEMBLY_ACC=CAM_ASM_000837 /TAXON_ID=420259 /ORGANISM="Thalassiosira gravida, Strain GMp14c1" /LENGTH=68 /DNA_ID=CAMNT_0048090533 /DNA_START=447 /DNA_END=653 /DNA_ORIENTATION=-
MTHIVRHVLVDKNDSNVAPLGEGLKGVFDDLGLGVLFYREEVAGVDGSVADSGEEEAGDGVLIPNYCY